ncbi:5-(carboxyamino)imidazole ribonucleotide synthase [Aeromicrobium chenweiae]|uniref:N5-carboxyaminoimidazole ribonucleotide synthase n=1 Tax=Aeromicrobium chenweiae TaxID=2079793 RepID=A0A2S0WSG7_9ACTN|nr:5-(carboxyamino)imidazole ribonucleotide synthase [Aeromicrobium chenweiae]AWB94194.1 5-(carboxyamino)imidazole ribonucleotide synthase [Aeromicrobium chenweiae]TGN34201.1 5-(carboxyamino)imidazole ribonucleotide synthase [Aeromicrobium chenweiae]
MPTPELAVIGGGQLARMMQQSATGLGLRIRLLAEGPDVSAAQVVPDHVVGDYTDLDTLRAVVADAPVVTFDHEHVPPEHLRALESEGHACRPGPHALLYAQDKGSMRERLGALGAPCPRNAPISSVEDLEAFGFPAVLKTTRGGYDGKGVWVVRSVADAEEAFAADRPLLAEELVDFRRELSALVARSPSGEVRPYPVVESRQADGVCAEVIAPAPDLDPTLAASARDLAVQIATELDVTGILAVELFETTDGRLLVNELAMRPHNTGHWSIDGAHTSQFENHLRAVLDLPLGSTDARQPWSVMVNVLGGTVEDLEAQRSVVLGAEPDVKIHLYGKAVKAGRKVGHVTAYGDDLDDVLTRARRAAALFTDGIDPAAS